MENGQEIKKTLSLVLPCHNEEQAIPKVLPALLKERQWLLQNTHLSQLEIIVVNDGSTDNSLQNLKAFEPDIKVISIYKNQGYGKALKKGFSKASGEWIGFFDLDGTCSPKDLWPLIQKMEQEDAGMILGNRLNNQSNMPIQRYIGNRLYRDLTRLLIKRSISDCCTGYRIFRRKYLPLFCEKLPDDLNYSLAMTIAFVRSGGQLSEKNIFYGERSGNSKLNPFTDGPLFLCTLVKYSISSKFSQLRLNQYIQ